jgi:phosphohistidine swiveling domain-containing protein
MSFQFGSKAETLAALAPAVTAARVLPLMHFSVADWRSSRAEALAALTAQPWAAAPMIVRSSAEGEDTAQSSQAGKYLSRADVASADLAEAIDAVVASYGAGGGRDRVLVQPMLTDVVCSGVAFTRDPSTGSAYLVVNACDGADTALITSGRSGDAYCHYHWRHGPAPSDRRIAALLALSRELFELCRLDCLDIEFAFTADGALWLLQVRPLVMTIAGQDDEATGIRLGTIVRKLAEAMRPHPFLHGSRTAFGVMPDWNPAEIIGIRPSPLALSLYRELVTDAIWAYQRSNYGYKNVRSFPLLVNFFGLPYIDIRVSFNSFVPRDVEPDLAEKLVDYYVERLLVKPALHDKVEFEVVLSAYTFDLPERLAALAAFGFSAEDCDSLAGSLRRLTNRIINRQTGLWHQDSEKLAILEERRLRIHASPMAPAEKIYWLLEDCKRYGTLPFAGLARAGFIAVQMLRSLVSTGVFSQDEYDAFMGGLSTIGSELAQDSASMERDEFLEKYGHLRPGTYDIRAPRYDEAPELFGVSTQIGGEAPKHPRFGLSLHQMRSLERLIREHGLETEVVGLFDFLQAAIEGRERAKFVFTRNLSDALMLFGEMGARLGFSREDMALADVRVIYELQASSDDAATLIGRSIALGRERHGFGQSIVLPAVISVPSDVWSFRMLDSEPNFITLGSVTAAVRTMADGVDLAGAIVCIPSADPGFDWIFGRGIAGLITMYGGTNSHMAIRAGELSIPAVIGAGELNFRRWSAAQALSIDCSNRKVEVLR